MEIWVDADACPVVVKDILFRAADREGIQLTLVANQGLKVPQSKFIRSIQVASGFDVADQTIVDHVESGDLVITSDIPLASDVLAKGASVFTPRGERLSEQNIKAKLNIRDFMETMRSSGVQTGGPPPFNHQDRKAFADRLDQFIAKVKRARQA